MEPSTRSWVLPLVVVGLAFAVVVLLLRLDAAVDHFDRITEQRDEALSRLKTSEEDRARLAAARLNHQRELSAKDGERALLQSTLAESRAAAIRERDAARAEVESLRSRLAATQAERDTSTASRLDLRDRQSAIEALLIRRERELVEAEKSIRLLRNPGSVDLERYRLADDDPRVRMDAIRRLGGLIDRPGAREALREALRCSRTLTEARAVLGAVGESAERVATEEAGHESVIVRRAAASVVSGRAVLARLLGDPDAGVRAAAASRIGRLRLVSAKPALRARRGDPSPGVRAAVAVASARVGDWPTVRELLADPDTRVARSALTGYCEAGEAVPDGTKVHPELEAAVALARRLLSERSGSD